MGTDPRNVEKELSGTTVPVCPGNKKKESNNFPASYFPG